MRVYSVIYLLILMIWIIIAIVLLSITLLFTVWFDKERVVIHKLISFFARFIFHLEFFWKVRVEGVENLDATKVYVITVNHQSMLDIPLMHFLPNIIFKWVSKREVFKIPAIGLALAIRGDIAISRGQSSAAKDLMEKGKNHIKNGTSIMIFPEGTRSKDGEVHLFKEGAFRLAKENKVAILPCVVDGTGRAIGKNVLNPTKFTIRILPSISVEEVQSADARDMAKRVQQLTKDNLQDMRERRDSGK